MGKWIIRLLLIMLTLLSLAACSLAGGSTIDPCNENGALLQDNFAGEQSCGWREYNQGGAVVEIAEGTLNISTSQTGQIWWTNVGRDFSDVIVTVQARQTSGPNNNAYGVLCRYQDENNFYIFLISGDGYYAIGKYQTGEEQITYLTPNQEYVFSDLINQGVATNLLRVSCVGNELSLSVNGLPLVTVTDSSFAGGDVGLGVSTLEPGTAVVQFDDLLVLAP
ncbi:MAG: hypothetical protein H6654_13540 [Ardenticatenaceae bacterium]|nr:hypothetical protein [Anaerolineales bacterium]MCB8941529.1 hypothetical protein [Ardenticatenaceae bacterium]MCB8974577.1 hypothetical protein [Ardenticatenaceae bacterium]